jgi:hypothetical protein
MLDREGEVGETFFKPLDANHAVVPLLL